MHFQGLILNKNSHICISTALLFIFDWLAIPICPLSILTSHLIVIKLNTYIRCILQTMSVKYILVLLIDRNRFAIVPKHWVENGMCPWNDSPDFIQKVQIGGLASPAQYDWHAVRQIGHYETGNHTHESEHTELPMSTAMPFLRQEHISTH